ncbi:dienelactone hydrolase family protein [Thalassoglobus sp.]|uniref:dienelactone hydrolase family protein n=1 Tax=Thalassoglobus sp. TaxID=2795869 RepID=UPI003AA89045
MLRVLSLLFVVPFLVSVSHAEVKTKKIAYEHGDAKLEGVLAWDDSFEGKRPGVLVVHEWWGLNDYAELRAKELAKLGYVAFALDMYGKGQVTTHPSQAGEWAGKIRENTQAWRERALAGLDVLKRQDNVDTANMAAVGYCFGGSTVLQLAYADAPLKGVVSFHGALVPPKEIEKIDSSVLVCHGASDSFVPAEQVQTFEKEMQAINADYQLVSYGGARHGFTNPKAGDFGIENLKYDENADKRSWSLMQSFFGELFPKKN